MQLPPRKEMDKSQVPQLDQDKRRTGIAMFSLVQNKIRLIVRYLLSQVPVLLAYMETLTIQAIDRRVNHLLLL